MDFESLGSCLNYLSGEAQIKTYLPKKAPFCQYCKFIKFERSFDRYYCNLTDEWILNPKKEKGQVCPIIWEE